MAICIFSTILYSIVKCSFICLFVVALDPCKINIEKYTKFVLFLSHHHHHKKNLSCPGIHYFNTLTRLIGISRDYYVIGKSFHKLKSFSMLGNLIGLI